MADEPGVPLRHYLDHHEGSGVLFDCGKCVNAFHLPVAQVIASLKARGLGGENTGIRQVAWLLKSPCKRCGAVQWETRPWFPPSVKQWT